ncbi:hypothetical protein NEHOM01_0986 [Nematocida homosporus]|uniref:uncharacterized protein n=1 Tax=Nematocida homosporus TaxID=1912981 RepID=UPI0022210E83|nr:uncharacterized protein NEHOM01_0986 [Nematocida homosporus]KAI5185660.1 hypothetical protein NEHOM01_0986 [Nematocida homosporus]
MRELRRIEEALRKIRIDAPAVLQERYLPGPLLQEVLSSEKKQEDVNEAYRMLLVGMKPLIVENTDSLEKSALIYHEAHQTLKALHQELKKAEEKTEEVLAEINSGNIAKRIEILKREREAEELDQKEKDIKEALALDRLSIKDIYMGRLKKINDHLKYVTSSVIRAEIKKRVESSAWSIKQDLEKKIFRVLDRGEEISSVEVAALKIIGGSFLDTVYEGLNVLLIESVNKASSTIREEVSSLEDSPSPEEEKEIVAQGLSIFSDRYHQILNRTVQLLQKEKETLPKLAHPGFHFLPSFYAEISLGSTPNASHSTFKLPTPEGRYNEQNLVHLFTKYPKKLLTGLVEKSKRVANSNEYTLANVYRTADSSQLYNELFLAKYGSLSESALDQERKDVSLQPIYKTVTEKAALVVYGYSQILTGILRQILAEALPAHINSANHIKDHAIEESFNRRKVSILHMIDKATSHAKVDHRASYLEKYTHRLEDILKATTEFTGTPAEGLEKTFTQSANEILNQTLNSLTEVFQILTKEKDLKPIKYNDPDCQLIEEIIIWNHPVQNNLLGDSLFLRCPESFFNAVSGFLTLHDQINHFLKTTPNLPTDLTQKTTSLFTVMKGYFISHVLSLARIFLDQMVLSGDLSDRRLLHLLAQNNLLAQISAPALQLYSCLHLFLNITKCHSISRRPSFRNTLATLQTHLDNLLPSTIDTSIYAPEYIIYALEAIDRKDKVYIQTLQRLFNHELFTRAIHEYILTAPK